MPLLNLKKSKPLVKCHKTHFARPTHVVDVVYARCLAAEFSLLFCSIRGRVPDEILILRRVSWSPIVDDFDYDAGNDDKDSTEPFPFWDDLKAFLNWYGWHSQTGMDHVLPV